MVEKLCNIKKITCDPGKKLTDLLIIIKCERELLVMAEYLISHIMLNISTHHMSIIGNKITASKLHQDQYQHSHPDFQNHGLRFSRWHFTYGIHNITNHQWNDKCHCCPKECKKKICKKQSLIWFIIACKHL